MSLFKVDSNRKIVVGNMTDVDQTTILKISNNLFVFTTIWLDEEDDQNCNVECTKMNLEQFKKEFEAQHCSPMHYLSKELFNWLID